MQPIIVSRKDDKYILIAGERRLRASKLADFKTIRAIVANIDIDRLQETALLENIQREDLNAIELASAFEELIKKHSLTHDELAKKIHKSRAFVTNVLRLLSLSDFTKKMIEENKISTGHAKILVGLTKEKEEKVVHSIINQKLSVRDTEKLVKDIKNNQTSSTKKNQKQDITFNLELLKKELSRIVSRVKVKDNSLIVEFDSQESIDVLLRRVM